MERRAIAVCPVIYYADRMTSKDSQLHVVFGRSAAGTLQQALEVAGRKGVVVAPYDDFSFGPIDSDDASARAQWVEDALGYSGWQNIIEDSWPVLSASMDASEPPIAWISPDSAHSAAGFLWWLSHMADKECQILDVPRLSLLDAQSMTEYLDKAEPLSVERRSRSLDLWIRLQAENAPLRILGSVELMSAPLDYFDAALLEHATPEWQKMARIVAGVLVDFSLEGIYQTSDLVLGARLADLAEAGKLEWRGDLGRIAACEMRLPA
ncbi:MAG: DUF1835 domain-containing protein [Oxalobacteraceae bacterium]|nr:MAG: DUF1835 domain-containing protein [Oxalobacteraceae bacterium]